MPRARASASPGIVGTSIVSIFGVGFATTGFSAAQARAEGFSPVAARIEANSRPRYYQGVKTMVELVADRTTRRLVGGSVIGEDGAAGRINVIATALQTRMRVDEFEQLDLAYSPPFSPVWDPILIAAQQLMKELAGIARDLCRVTKLTSNQHLKDTLPCSSKYRTPGGTRQAI